MKTIELSFMQRLFIGVLAFVAVGFGFGFKVMLMAFIALLVWCFVVLCVCLIGLFILLKVMEWQDCKEGAKQRQIENTIRLLNKQKETCSMRHWCRNSAEGLCSCDAQIRYQDELLNP